jgi:protein O-GlcNAc transferase
MNDVSHDLARALALLQANRAADAEAVLALLCQASGASVAECWFLIGVARHLLGRLDHALAAFDQAVRLQPSHVKALTARATVLGLLGRSHDALAAFRQVLALRPRDAEVLTNIGIALEQCGEPDAALRRYAEAIDADPSCHGALLNFSALLMRFGRFDEALAVTEAMVLRYPAAAVAHFNRAEALLALDRYAEAIGACDRVLALDPQHLGAHVDRAVALACRGEFDASRHGFDAARALDQQAFGQFQRRAWMSAGPELRAGWTHGPEEAPDPRAIYLVRGAARLAHCDWHGRADFLAQFERIVRAGVAQGDPVCDWSLPFSAMSLPLADDVREAVASAVARQVEGGVAHVRLPPARPVRSDRERLRIGYVSPKFSNHPGVTLCAPVLERHDRDRVSVFGYALNPHDTGAKAERFRRSCDQVRECWGFDDVTVAQRIRDDAIHVLVDLGGYTDFARPEVFALGAAPIQVAYVGFMSSMAAPWMHYMITDRVATPPEDATLWAERLVYLPRTLLAYDPPPAQLPQPPSREQCGLPPDGFVFCCINSLYKIEPESFRVWMRLLARVPGSVLWLLREPGTDRNLRDAASEHGVDPDRLVFADRVEHADHLVRQQLIDLFLDTFQYNAHTTAAEAYYACVPVLTLPGRTMVSRCGASIAHGIGLPELIAESVEDYEARAYRLATMPGELAAIKAKLLEQRVASALFDPAGLARCFEQAFEQMWAQHTAGLAPESFSVPAEAMASASGLVRGISE